MIELLVVLSVTTLLTIFMILWGRSSREQTVLYIERAQLVQVLTRAKEMAISTSKGGPGSTCGYGVNFNYELQSYALFQVLGTSRSACLRSLQNPVAFLYEARGGTSNLTYIEKESFKIRPGAVIVSAVLSESPLQDIFFAPPDPRTLIWTTDGVVQTEAQIHMQTADGSFIPPPVAVNAFGQISL